MFRVVPCRNSSFCKMKSDEAENCLKSGEADEFFPTLFRADVILSKKYGIYAEHLIFLVTFFIKEKSDKRQVKSSNKLNSNESI